MLLKEKKIIIFLVVYLDIIIFFMGWLWSGLDFDNIILRFYDLVWYLRINIIYKIIKDFYSLYYKYYFYF